MSAQRGALRRARRPTAIGRLTILTSLAISIGMLSLASPASAVTGWTSPQVAVPAADQPWGGSIAVDAAGHAFIAYGRTGPIFGVPGSIWIATNKSGHWVRTKVITGLFEAPSIALDAAGKIHLGLQRDKRKCIGGGMCFGEPIGISYATDRSGHWVVSTVSNGPHVAPLLRLNNRTAHIAYRSATTVFYATNKTGHWVRTTVATASVVGDLDMTIAGGVPHLTYATPSNLYHAFKPGATFTKELVDPAEVAYAQTGAIGYFGPTPVILLFASGPMGSASGPAIHGVTRHGGVWGSSMDEPFPIDTAEQRAFVATGGASPMTVTYTASGYGVSFVALGGPITPVALTAPDGQDMVRGAATAPGGTTRVLFQRSGALLYLGQN